MKNEDFRVVLKYFVLWRLFLFLVLAVALWMVSLQNDFLGGGIGNYTKVPHLWAWVNFDGEHYLSIVRSGYQPLTYFFFPFYPMLVRFFSNLFNNSFTGQAAMGLLISHTSFLIALSGFWKLMLLDYKKSIVRLALLLLLTFPTSFYFASFYTESLFLALVIWSFYFARKKKWIYVGVLAGLSTATRIVGLALLPALIVEVVENVGGIKKIKKVNVKQAVGIMLIPLGLIFYMVYLNKVAGDPLEFFHSVGIYGQQRSSSIVLLPQVFFRYIFKILPAINYGYFPVVFTTWLEFLVAVIFGLLAIFSFFKLRLSYAVYLTLGYLIPTLAGSFSSLPRYVLVLFPAFIIVAELLSTRRRLIKLLTYIILLVNLAIACALFTRGYWIS